MSRELNATAASVLGFLQDGQPRTGWEIAADVEKMIGDFWNVTRSQVYRELRTLAAAGLVEVGETGPRDKRPYTISPQGRAAFLEWLQEMPGRDIVRIPLLLKLLFSEHLDDDTLAAFVEHHRTAHHHRLTGYRELLSTLEASMPAVARVLEYGIAHEEAVVAWLEGLPWHRADTARNS
jgi:DNA-binding PadR family transcriptional regulator